MKRLSTFISIICLVAFTSSLAIPDIKIQEKAKDEVQNEQSEESQSFQISSGSDAIVSLFEIELDNDFTVLTKSFKEIKKISGLSSYIIRDFKISSWKRLFTKIIQVHGP